MKKNIQKGFTLVELMIVVAIIGILAAIAIPKFAQMLEKSREGATKGNVSAIKSAISIYYGDHEGVWPGDLTEAVTTNIGWSFLTSYMDDLPAVKVTGGNANNPSPVTVKPNENLGWGQYYVVTAAPATTVRGHQWAYDAVSGKIWVNSGLVDSKNKGYTTYGYE